MRTNTPAVGDETVAVDSVTADVTGSARERRRPRRTQESGFGAPHEISRQLVGPVEPAPLLERLSASAAHLVGARRACFGRLLLDGRLRGEPGGFGISPEVLGELHVRCAPGGSGLIERIVFDDIAFHAVVGDDPRLSEYREALEKLDVQEVMAVSWRAGDDPLGVLVVDGPLSGHFRDEDVTALRTVALAAALVWQLHSSEVLVHRLLEAAPDAMILADGGGAILLVNAQVERLFGYPRGALLGRSIETLLPEHVRDAHRRHRDAYLADPHVRAMGVGLELAGRRCDGSRFPVDVSLSPLRTDSTVLVVAAIRDISERKAVETALAGKVAELASIAATDPLTGLPNRREFERILTCPHPDRFALLAIDVDRLKAINDGYGHEAGDAHLRAVALALRLALREDDTVARTGGDEFSAFLPGQSLAEAVVASERLRRAMHGIAVPFGSARVSIGCAAGSPDEDGSKVLTRADEALYRAKAKGRDRVESSPGGAAAGIARVRASWERELPDLIRRQRIVAAYQPIVHLRNGSVLGYEALARVVGRRTRTGVEGLFAAAQRLGLQRDLDWLCRRAAVRDAAVLAPVGAIFVNVSVTMLLDHLHPADQMTFLASSAGVSAQSLVLEITEREAVRDVRRLHEVLTEYRAEGFRFALDDVGEGHSTFEVLAAAVPEFVKVSAALTRGGMARGPEAVLRSLMAFAESAGVELVAEGLETASDVQHMRDLGVTFGQGYALGRPALARHWRVTT